MCFTQKFLFSNFSPFQTSHLFFDNISRLYGKKQQGGFLHERLAPLSPSQSFSTMASTSRKEGLDPEMRSTSFSSLPPPTTPPISRSTSSSHLVKSASNSNLYFNQSNSPPSSPARITFVTKDSTCKIRRNTDWIYHERRVQLDECTLQIYKNGIHEQEFVFTGGKVMESRTPNTIKIVAPDSTLTYLSFSSKEEKADWTKAINANIHVTISRDWNAKAKMIRRRQTEEQLLQRRAGITTISTATSTYPHSQ